MGLFSYFRSLYLPFYLEIIVIGYYKGYPFFIIKVVFIWGSIFYTFLVVPNILLYNSVVFKWAILGKEEWQFF